MQHALFGLVATIVFSLAARGSAQDTVPATSSFDTQLAQARAKNVEGLKFTLDLGARRQFHRGEVIPIALRFSSEPYTGHKLDARRYDRSGRLNDTDFYIVDRPLDAPDPLGWVFREGPIFGGGLSSPPAPLNPKVQELKFTLNEHRRFDKPGVYRLFVMSNRVFKATQRHSFGWGPDAILSASEPVDFEILPGEEWAQNRSREIAALLDQGSNQATATSSSTWGSAGEARNNSLARELRFLDTPLSRRLMARHYDSARFPLSGDFSFGFLGTRDRADAIEAIRESLHNVDGAVAPGLLRDLQSLLFEESNPPALPLYPAKASKESAEMQSYRARRRARDQKRREIERAAEEELALAVERKRGAALAVSLSTLLERQGEAWRSFDPLNEAAGAPRSKRLRQQIIRSWSDLPRAKQKWMLSERWPLVRDAALLPLLKKASDATMIVEPNNSDNFVQREWHGLLLHRIAQISPLEGRKYLMREIARPSPRTDIGALLDLPDDTLPALDGALLKNLQSAKDNGDRDRIAQLVARYASLRLASPVEKMLAAGRDGSQSYRKYLLAFVARVRPREGAALIEAEVKRQQQILLEDIAAFVMNPHLEALCLKYLRGPDRGLAGDAAAALALAGSPRAEAALWARMQAWHAALQNKTLNDEQARFEEQLALALSQMLGPTLSAEKHAQLLALCLAPRSRQMLKNGGPRASRTGPATRVATAIATGPTILLRPAPTWLREGIWSLGNGSRGSWSLQALTRKLQQFPRGTTFGFRTEMFEAAPDARAVLERLQAWGKAHGFQIKPVKAAPGS